MRQFQISEEDLAELERMLPDLANGVMTNPRYGNRDKVQLRRVQEIIMNVRWRYGPWSDVQVFPADGPLPEEGQETPAK
jgi:hypothetical protein